MYAELSICCGWSVRARGGRHLKLGQGMTTCISNTKHIATRAVCSTPPLEIFRARSFGIASEAFFEPKLATGLRKDADDEKQGRGAGNRAMKNSLLVNDALLSVSSRGRHIQLHFTDCFYPHENLYLGLLWLVGSGVVRFLPRVMVSGFGHKKCSCHVLLLVCGNYITGDAILEVHCTCGMMLLTM